jgi:hypothetical protein
MLEQARLPDGVWIAVAAAVGSGLFAGGFRKLVTARRILDTPTARVRSLALGSVEVAGVAATDAPLEAPFSGKPAAYWVAEVDEFHKRNWRRVRRETSSEPFFVDDGSGRVAVLPDGADAHLPVDLRLELSGAYTAPDTVARALERLGLTRGLFAGFRRLRVTERRVDVGGPVYVYGVAQDDPGARRRAGERVNERLRALRADPEALARVDRDGDGRIDGAEWEVARARVAAEASAQAERDRVVIARGAHGELFLISDHDERDLVTRLRFGAAFGVLGGGALLLGAAAWLLHELGRLGLG